MTQNEFDFLKDALGGKCDALLQQIVIADTWYKEKLKQTAEQKTEEIKEVEAQVVETKEGE